MNAEKFGMLITFYDFSVDKCKASILFEESNITISDFVVSLKADTITVNMPSNGKDTNQIWEKITWKEVRAAITDEFNKKFGEYKKTRVVFHDEEYNGNCLADVECVFLKTEIKDCSLVLVNGAPFVHLPENIDEASVFDLISWSDLRKYIAYIFKRNKKEMADKNKKEMADKNKEEMVEKIEVYAIDVSVYDITDEGTALFEIKIPALDYCFSDGNLYYVNQENISVNLPGEFPVSSKNGLTRKRALQLIREKYLEEIEGREITPYCKKEDNQNRNKYGRIKDAEQKPFVFVPNTKLRPIKVSDTIHTAKNNSSLLYALMKNDIGAFEIDTLSLIEKFRYMTNAMIIDMFASGYTSHGWRNINLHRLSDIFKRLARYNLVTISKFVTVDENEKDSITGEVNFQIYSLADVGARLLSELNREHRYNPFDIYQNGNDVKSVLAINQWLTYWLSSYPDEIKNDYDTAKVIHVVGAKKNGAKIYGSVTCNDILMIGEPMRRTYDFELSNDNENIKEKLVRMINTINFDGDLYASKIYKTEAFHVGKETIICYVCEDDEHVNEVWDTISSVIQNFPRDRIWFTTDTRLYNYSNEGERFFWFDDDGNRQIVDLNKRLGLGKERAYMEE